MNNKPLVSLIIPVYNVEAYLRECLDSVCNQTYQDLEIILVNDGSTDGSLKICEEYSSKDSRIKVLTKENGGASTARNAGIRVANGDFIGFVDGDDKIHPMFVQVLISALLDSDCDISACDYCTKESKMICEDEDYIVVDHANAVSGILDDDGYKCFVWNKLYKKELFNSIQFAEGKIYEDIKLIYDVFKAAGSLAYVKQPMCFYRTRRGSVTHLSFTQGTFFLLESIDFVINDAKTISGIDYSRLFTGYLSYYMGFVRRGMMARAKITAECDRLRNYIKGNRRLIKASNNIHSMKKIELTIYAYVPTLYRFILSIVSWGK